MRNETLLSIIFVAQANNALRLSECRKQSQHQRIIREHTFTLKYLFPKKCFQNMKVYTLLQNRIYLEYMVLTLWEHSQVLECNLYLVKSGWCKLWTRIRWQLNKYLETPCNFWLSSRSHSQVHHFLKFITYRNIQKYLLDIFGEFYEIQC